MDDKSQMYIYEAVITTLLIVGAVFFFFSLETSPTLVQSDPLYQLETKGADALRALSNKNLLNLYLSSNQIDQIVSELNDRLPLDVSYKLTVNSVSGKKSYDKEANLFGSQEVGDSTVSAHQIVTTNNGDIYDVHLTVWYVN